MCQLKLLYHFIKLWLIEFSQRLFKVAENKNQDRKRQTRRENEMCNFQQFHPSHATMDTLSDGPHCTFTGNCMHSSNLCFFTETNIFLCHGQLKIVLFSQSLIWRVYLTVLTIHGNMHAQQTIRYVQSELKYRYSGLLFFILAMDFFGRCYRWLE